MLGRPPKYRPEMCKRAIELMTNGDSKEVVQADLGIAKSTFYEWINPESEWYNQEFSDAIKEGERACQAFWEKELKKATLGINKDANPTLMIFNMKNRFREQWADMQIHNHTIKRTAEDLSDEELAAIAAGRSKGAAEA